MFKIHRISLVLAVHTITFLLQHYVSSSISTFLSFKMHSFPSLSLLALFGGIYFAPLPNLFSFPFITIHFFSIAFMLPNVSFSHLLPQVLFHSIFTSLTKSPASRQCISASIYFFHLHHLCVYV